MTHWIEIAGHGPVPKKEPLVFRMPDGSEVRGTYTPFWCGSDCPCGDPDDPDRGSEFSEEPECWGVKLPDGKIHPRDPKAWRREVDAR